jgi:chaperonin cofactor prefoldin
MGFIWDIIQQSQIGDTANRASTLERRVEDLEHQIRSMNRALVSLVQALEKRFGEDLNGDGRVG